MRPRSRPSVAAPSPTKMALLLLLHAAPVLTAARWPRHVNNVAEVAANDVAEAIANGTDAPRQKCEGGRYECVPFYHCKTDDMLTDGIGLIDIRFGGELTENAKNSPVLTHSECTDFMDVCCTSPQLGRSQGLTEAAGYTPRCGHRNPDGLNVRIQGFQHHETQFGEFPWHVAIVRPDRNGSWMYVGGGSIIHPQVILTAAHTVRGRTDLEVRLGDWDTQHNTEFFNHLNMGVAKVIRHPDYNGGNLHSDVALIILSSRMDLQPHMDTICLPPADFRPAGDCVVTGWGRDAFSMGAYQTVLKSVSLPLVESAACERRLRRTRLGDRFRLDESFVCAGGQGRGQDACTGDGGSALVCADPAAPDTYVQVGIVSWGIGCGRAGLPGVYTDVRRFVGWIDGQIEAAGL